MCVSEWVLACLYRREVSDWSSSQCCCYCCCRCRCFVHSCRLLSFLHSFFFLILVSSPFSKNVRAFPNMNMRFEMHYCYEKIHSQILYANKTHCSVAVSESAKKKTRLQSWSASWLLSQKHYRDYWYTFLSLIFNGIMIFEASVGLISFGFNQWFSISVMNVRAPTFCSSWSWNIYFINWSLQQK